MCGTIMITIGAYAWLKTMHATALKLSDLEQQIQLILRTNGRLYSSSSCCSYVFIPRGGTKSKFLRRNMTRVPGGTHEAAKHFF